MTESTQEPPAPAAPETIVERTDEKPPKPATSPGTRGFLGGVAGGLVASVIAAGGLLAAWPSLHDVLLDNEVRRLGLLEHAIDDINPRLVAVEREQIRTSGGADAAGMAQNLAQKVATLETQAHAPLADPRIGALVDRVDRLSGDVSKLVTDIQTLRGAIPPEGTILRLAERAESAEKEAHAIAQQHASAQALLLVIGQLRDAVDRGDPFKLELQAFRRIAGKDDLPQIDTLSAYATEGIARKETLLEGFPAIAKTAIDAELLPPDDGFWRHSLRKLMSLVDFRQIDGQGTGTTAIVARAEMKIKGGDLAKAVHEMASLTGRPAESVAPWLKAAQIRLDADRALSELSASAAAQSAQNGG
jgi:hypothetical protein